MNKSSFGADCFSTLVFLPHYSAFHQVKQLKKKSYKAAITFQLNICQVEKMHEINTLRYSQIP